MKHIILFIALFGVLLANAQEMDTTFVVNEQGQTVGIIHEKGTVPVMPQQQQAAQPVQMQAAPVQQANPAFGYDSTAYYMDMINVYTEAAVGVGMLVVGAQESCDEDAWGRETCTSNSDELAGTGAFVMIGGALVFGAGTIVKIVGSSKIRRARRYEDRLQKYKMRQQSSLKLRFDPLIDPINKQVGGNLALNF